MKKIILASLLIIAYNTVSANFAYTGGWRWRNDDGSETAATWIAGQNTAPVINSTSKIYRLRIEMYNGSTTETVDLTSTEILDSTDGVPGWHHISASVMDDNPFTLTSASTFVHDGNATTKQLLEKGYTFQAGKIVAFSDYLESDEIAIGNETEYEYCLKPTSFILPNTTYFFKLDAQSDLAPGYTHPSVTTSADILPVNLSNFTAQSLGQSVKLQWTTATEQNNDRFDILRSADGKTNWQIINSVKGKGTSNQPTAYAFTDNNPLNGSNFYRLKQYDLDGKFTESDIRSLAMQISKALLNVFPNPSKGSVINFTLNNFKGGDITAILSDMNGKVVHREIIAGTAYNSYSLHLKNAPAPGMYMLQVKAENFEKTVQVVVQ